MVIPDAIDGLQDLLRAIRIADIVDIAFISVVLYGVLTWFRETTSRSVYVGLSILAVVYLFARVFDMYMTALVFQAVFAVLLVALVVVFQEDIRRVFERVAAFGTIRDSRRTTTFAHVDTIVGVAADLAAKKIGGLIVLKGRETLERHIDGGIELEGQISKPLLESIFDPHSPGHDGAVVVDNNRIRLYAAHLPLSKNIKQIGPRGTRHSAAVGLSEVSDALTIVVSEERGEISLAEQGKLTTGVSPAKLRARIEQFCEQVFPKLNQELLWQRLIRKHAALKLVSIILACVGWYFLSYQAGTIQRTFQVPIELRDASETLVFDYQPTEVRVTLSGLERAFLLLAPSTLKMSLDVSEFEEGSYQIPLEDEHFSGPSNLSVYGIEPRTLYLDAHVLVPKSLPIEVEVDLQKPLAKGVILKSVEAVPPTMPVLVWRANWETTDVLLTAPVDLSKVTESATIDAMLVLPRHVRLPKGKQPTVKARVEVERLDNGP